MFELLLKKVNECLGGSKGGCGDKKMMMVVMMKFW